MAQGKYSERVGTEKDHRRKKAERTVRVADSAGTVTGRARKIVGFDARAKSPRGEGESRGGKAKGARIAH